MDDIIETEGEKKGRGAQDSVLALQSHAEENEARKTPAIIREVYGMALCREKYWILMASDGGFLWRPPSCLWGFFVVFVCLIVCLFIIDSLLLERLENLTVSWNYHPGLPKGGFENLAPRSDRENSIFVLLRPFIFTVWWAGPVAADMTDALSLQPLIPLILSPAGRAAQSSRLPLVSLPGDGNFHY